MFGMGTGVTLSSLPPKIVNYFDVGMIADFEEDVKGVVRNFTEINFQ